MTKVLTWVDEFTTPDAAADRNALLKHAEARGCDRATVDHTIEELLAKGELMEPQTGRVRRT